MTTGSASEPSQSIAWASLAPGVNVLNVGHSQECWRVYHDSYCVAMVRGGSGRWKYRGKHNEIRPNALMLSEPGEVHTTTAVEVPGSFTSLFLAPEFIEQHFGSRVRGTIHFRAAQLSSTLRWQTLARKLTAITQRYAAAADNEMLVDSLLLALGELFADAAQDKPKAESGCITRLTRAREAIIDNYRASPRQRLNIEELAAQLDVDRYSLTHDFTRQFGYSPSQLHTLLRVAKTKQLLVEGVSSSLAEIAREAGYCDQSQMTGDFRKHWHITPGRLQQLIDSSL